MAVHRGRIRVILFAWHSETEGTMERVAERVTERVAKRVTEKVVERVARCMI
jgi:hypothetical protein